MKTMKRISCLLLALALILALSVTAFAEGETEAKRYEIYQIFTGDYSEGILSNVMWGENGTGYVAGETTAVPDEVLEALEAVNTEGTSDTQKLAVITQYANLGSDPFKTGNETTYTVPNGYYLVKNTDKFFDGVENAFYTLYVVKVVNGTLSFSPKGDVPKSEKKILDTASVDVNEASIGDTVDYQITGTLPTNFDDYNTYYYVFTDTLSKGLDFNDDVKVEVVNIVDEQEIRKDVTKYFYVGATDYNETTGTTITIGIQDIKALNKVDGVSATKDSKIVVTYSATLNENAVIAGEGNPNDVKLAYSNDPNKSGEGTTTPPPENPQNPPVSEHPIGETPEDTVVTFTTELTILKTDEDGVILPGAEFTLTGDGVKIVLVTTEKFTEAANGEYWKLKNGTFTTTAPTITDDETDNREDYDSTTTKYSKTVELIAKGNGKTETKVVGVIDDGGHVTFSGLGAGTYTITETKTPAGYNTIAPIEFTITFDAATQKFSSTDPIIVESDNTLATTIVNKAGSTLPETGGIGTTIFYVLGSVLLLGAAILLITKKRMSAQK